MCILCKDVEGDLSGVIEGSVDQCLSTFVRPRPGKLFLTRGPGPNKFTRKYLFSLF